MKIETPELSGKRSGEVASQPQLVAAGSLEPEAKEPAGFSGVLGTLGRRRQALLLLAGVCLASLFLLFHSHLQSYFAPLGSLLNSVKAIYKDLVPLSWRLRIYPYREHFLEIFANPYYYLGVGAVLTLEWLFPAKKEQRVFTVGLAQDFVYYLYVSMVLIYAAGPYMHFLDGFYTKRLNFLTIQAVAAWPIGIRAVLGLVFNDLLHWTHHFLRHRIKPLWYFHKVHHSQREMNLFADVRSHFVETFFALGLIFIPLNMFSVSFANTGLLYFIPVLYFRLYHANIKTNLGPLKYILVTPQSHRIHHSIEKKHWDKNYGFIFTIWDQVFGTQYKNYDEYPDTGVDDVNFPVERSFTGVVKTFFAQLVYPFQQLVQRKS